MVARFPHGDMLISYESTPIQQFFSDLANQVRVSRVDVTSSASVEVGVIAKSAYELLDAPATSAPHVSGVLDAYREGGVSRVSRFIDEVIVSHLREVYSSAGLEFDDEVCFSKLADLGLLDEDTAVYLIASYMSIEQAIEELEELEEVGGERERIGKALEDIASKLLEVTRILNQIRTSIPQYERDYSYYTTYTYVY